MRVLARSLMLLILICLTLAILTALGHGYVLISLLLGCRRADAAGLGEAGIAGLWLLALAAPLLHLLVPLDGTLGSAVLLTGLAGLYRHRQAARHALGTLVADHKAGTLVLLALAGAALIMEFRGPAFYDTGLYHLQQILMQTDGPVILGAANIHMRFGYNSLLYPLSGLLWLPGSGLASALTVNPLLFLFAVAALAVRPAADDAAPQQAVRFFLLLFVFLFSLARGWVSSPMSDIGTGMLLAVATAKGLELALARGGTAPAPDMAAPLLILCVSLAITIKLSALPALGLLVLTVGNWHPLRWPPAARRAWIAAGLIGTVWLFRGLLLSGCLAYPAASTCVTSLPWTVPLETALRDITMMRHYARVAGGNPALSSDGWSWLGGWLAACGPALLAGALMFGMVLLAGWRQRRATGGSAISGWGTVCPEARPWVLLHLAVLISGVAFWFLTAPLLRYGLGFIGPALALAGGLVAPAPRGRAIWPRWSAVAPATLIVAGWVAGTVPGAVPPWPSVRESRIAPVVTASGIRLWVPQGDDRCWAAPRPCTPEPADGLVYDSAGPWLMARQSR